MVVSYITKIMIVLKIRTEAGITKGGPRKCCTEDINLLVVEVPVLQRTSRVRDIVMCKVLMVQDSVNIGEEDALLIKVRQIFGITHCFDSQGPKFGG